MTSELFSVVIVSYNQANVIYDCIDSILFQEYPAIELIIADDHSYDFDKQKLCNYIETHKQNNLKQYKVFTNEKNLGIVKNCNKGCSLVEGEYLKTIAADDTFHDKHVFERMAKKLKNPRNGIVCARGKAIRENGEPTEDRYPSDIEFNALEKLSGEDMYCYLVTRPWSAIFAPGVFWRTDLLKKINGYDEKYLFTEDWPCWIRLAKENVDFCFVDDFVVNYRYGGISNQSLDGMPNQLRKVHYDECADLLKNEYENVKKKFGKGKALRCWYCEQAIELKRVLEFDWFEMGFMQKLKYRIKKLPVLCYIKLMSAINYNKWFSIKKNLIITALFMCFLLTGRSIFPGYDLTVLIAWLTLLMILVVIMKIAGNFVLFLLKKRAMMKTRLSGR